MALPTAADVSDFLQGASLKLWTPESLSESTLARYDEKKKAQE